MSRMDASRLPSMSAARAALPSLTKGLFINSLCFFVRNMWFVCIHDIWGASTNRKLKTCLFAIMGSWGLPRVADRSVSSS